MNEEMTFQEIIDRMSTAEDYDVLYDAAGYIKNSDLRAEVMEEISTCEEDGDPAEVAYSVVTSDLLDSMIDTPNVEVLKEKLDDIEKTKAGGFYKDDKYYLCEPDDPEVEDNEVKYDGEGEIDNLWTAVCCGDTRYLKNYYANGGKPNQRYHKFDHDNSLIMGALRQTPSSDMSDVIQILKDNGETILKDEVEEYKKIMAKNTYEDELTRGAVEESKKVTEGIEFENNEEEDLARYIFDDIVDGSTIDRDGTIKYFDAPELDSIQAYYDENVTEESYNKVVDKIKNALEQCKFYSDYNGTGTYIELNDNHTLWDIKAPEEYNDDGSFDDFYRDLISEACDDFKTTTGEELYLVGRSGRHACVEISLDNVLRYNELKEAQENIEQKVIKDANIYLGSDLDESKMIESKSTKQDFEDYCNDKNLDSSKKSSVNKYLNDYAKNYSQMNGIENLEDEMKKVRKELREGISKK